jgi:ABC-type multidrug transport system fused ATPase/permease subunit
MEKQRIQKKLTQAKVMIIISIVVPIVTAIVVFTNSSPELLASGIGIMIRVGISSSVFFGYAINQYNQHKRAYQKELIAEEMGIPSDSFDVVYQSDIDKYQKNNAKAR